VVKLSKGLPSHIPSKLPTTIYRGSPSDEALQEKIKQYLQTKGWSFDESSIDFPDPEKVAAFQRKVRRREIVARTCAPCPSDCYARQCGNTTGGRGLRAQRHRHRKYCRGWWSAPTACGCRWRALLISVHRRSKSCYSPSPESDALFCTLPVAFLDKQTEGRNSVRAAADDDSDDEVSLLAAPTASEAPRSSKAVPAVAHGRYNLADSSDSD